MTAQARPQIRPFRSARPDRYCRLFEGAPADPNDESLEKLHRLALSMKKDGDQSPVPFPFWDKNPPAAGYTYFGQFIDHNLTEDDTAIRDAGQRQPWETVNGKGPWLNLSGIYNPAYDQGRWKELYQPDGIRFKLGGPPLPNNEQFDIPLGADGYPVLGDARNNENVIVRQIHAMFLKLHNLAVDELVVTQPNLPSRDLFATARDRVRWQYQYLVHHDFLGHVCKKSVFDELVTQNAQPRIDWTNGFSIPIEFSQAVLRFGHSMVRPKYNLNGSNREVPLEKLLCAGQPRALELREAVHWSSFLTGLSEKAMRIDTAVASPLHGLDDKDIHAYVNTPIPHHPFSLPERTLMRGAKTRLPTGQSVAKAFGVPPIQPTPEKLDDGSVYDPGKDLEAVGLSGDTPLWYYFLLEAEIDKQERGARLGELGSRLLIETIHGALSEDPDSYIRQRDAGSEPDPWLKTSKPVKTLLELAQLLGLEP